MRNSQTVLLLFALVTLMYLTGCKNKSEPYGYRVVGFDSTSGEWTLVHTDTVDGKLLRQRLVVVCKYAKWPDHEGSGKDACHLQVGELMVPTLSPSEVKAGHPVIAMEWNDGSLTFEEGSGTNEVYQSFEIKKSEIIAGQ
jgi:hypothetical protein